MKIEIKIKLIIIFMFLFVALLGIESYAGEFSFGKDVYTIYQSMSLEANFQEGDDDYIANIDCEPNEGIEVYIQDDRTFEIYDNTYNGYSETKTYYLTITSNEGYEKVIKINLVDPLGYGDVFFVGEKIDVSDILSADNVDRIEISNPDVLRMNGNFIEAISTGSSELYVDNENGGSGLSVYVLEINSTSIQPSYKVPIMGRGNLTAIEIDINTNNKLFYQKNYNLSRGQITVDGDLAEIHQSCIEQTADYNKLRIIFKDTKTGDITPGVTTCHIKLGNAVDETIEIEFYQPISDFKLNKRSLTMEVGDTFKLEKIISPENGVSNSIDSFVSSDESIATVDDEGNVTALKTGLAVITCEVDGYNFNATTPQKTKYTYDCTVLVLGKQLQVTTLNVISLLKFNTKTAISSVVTKENFPILNENYNVKVLSKAGVEKTEDDNIGSRDQIVVTSPENEEVTTFTAVVKGDVSGNGLTKVYDAYQVLNQSISNNELDEINSYAMDYNDDGDVKIYDAYKFLNVAISQ